MCSMVGIDIVQCGRRTGSNNEHAFKIFKDDKHVMYIDEYGLECRSIYYCLDVSFSHWTLLPFLLYADRRYD